MMRRTKPCADRTSKTECERTKFPRCSWHAIMRCFDASNPPKLKKAPPAALKSNSPQTPPKLGVDTKLPPGKGGGKSPLDDCFDPSCHSKQELFKMMVGKSAKGKTVPFSSQSTGESSEQNKTSGGAQGLAAEKPYECPADREELGRQSWTLLHSIAAYYPEKPSEEHRRHAHSFLEALSHLYPCTHCAYHLRDSMAKAPPKLESRTDFSMWLCAQHNDVNRRLGKPEFECAPDVLLRRWRTGDPRCWMQSEGSDAGETASESLGQSDD